ncbi:MAG: DUF2799 domain-containing protein [Desulfobulbales bacterium]|jgi:hypothetical protein
MIQRFPGISVILILITFISGLFVLSGCATLGKDECLNADWRTIGYEDGAYGYPASRIGSHREDCAKHGVTPDFNRYEQGRLEGLREYCTPQKGYGLGTSGRQYNYVCPRDLESTFLKGYYQGKNVHAAQIQVKGQEADLKKMHDELRAVDKNLHDYETELVHDDIGPRRRKKLLEEFKILTEQRRYILDEIVQQEALLEDSRQNLREIMAQNPY